MGTDKEKLGGRTSFGRDSGGGRSVSWHGLDVRRRRGPHGQPLAVRVVFGRIPLGNGAFGAVRLAFDLEKCSLERAFVVCSLGLGLLFTAVLPRCPRRTRWPTISPPTRCPTG